METAADTPENMAEGEDREPISEPLSMMPNKFSPDETKKAEIDSKQPIESIKQVATTEKMQIATDIEVDHVYSDIEGNKDESSLEPPPVPHAAGEETLGLPKVYEAAKMTYHAKQEMSEKGQKEENLEEAATEVTSVEARTQKTEEELMGSPTDAKEGRVTGGKTEFQSDKKVLDILRAPSCHPAEAVIHNFALTEDLSIDTSKLEEACNKKESTEETLSTITVSLEDDSRKTNFPGAEDKVLETSVISEGKVMDLEASRKNENTKVEKDEREEVMHDGTSKVCFLDKTEHQDNKNKELAIENLKETKENPPIPLLTKLTEAISSESTEKGECEKPDDNFPITFGERSLETIKLSEKIDLASTKNAIQDKNNSESSLPRNIEGILFQKKDGSDTFKEANEREQGATVKGSQDELENQNEITEKIVTVESGPDSGVKDGENAGPNVDVPLKKSEDILQKEVREVSLTEDSSKDYKDDEKSALIANKGHSEVEGETSQHEEHSDKSFLPKNESGTETHQKALSAISKKIETESFSQHAETITDMKQRSLNRNPEELPKDKRKEKTTPVYDIPEKKNFSTADSDEMTENDEVTMTQKNTSDLCDIHQVIGETVEVGGRKQDKSSGSNPEEHSCEGNRVPMEEKKHYNEANEASGHLKSANFEHTYTEGEVNMEEIQQKEATDGKLQTIATKEGNNEESTFEEAIPVKSNSSICNEEEADNSICQEDENRRGHIDETASVLNGGDKSCGVCNEAKSISHQEINRKVNEIASADDKEKERKIEMTQEEHSITEQLPKSTGEETIKCCQEDETKEEEHETQMAEGPDTASAQDNEKQVQEEQNRTQVQLIASIQKEITAECSKEEKVTTNAPKEEVQQMVQRSDGDPEIRIQNTEQEGTAKDNLAASAGEKTKESFCLKEKEHNRELDTLGTWYLEQNLETTSPTDETKSKDLDDETKTTKDCDTQGTTGPLIEEKQRNQNLAESSFSVPKVSEKEKAKETLKKEESTITEVTQGTDSNETEQEDKMKLDVSAVASEEGLETIRPHETLSYNSHTRDESTESSDLCENKDMENPTAVKDGADEAGRKIEHAKQSATNDALPRSDNQKEGFTGETSLDKILEQNLREPPRMPSKEHRLMTDEMSETTQESPKEVESLDVPSEKIETAVFDQHADKIIDVKDQRLNGVTEESPEDERKDKTTCANDIKTKDIPEVKEKAKELSPTEDSTRAHKEEDESTVVVHKGHFEVEEEKSKHEEQLDKSFLQKNEPGTDNHKETLDVVSEKTETAVFSQHAETITNALLHSLNRSPEESPKDEGKEITTPADNINMKDTPEVKNFSTADSDETTENAEAVSDLYVTHQVPGETEKVEGEKQDAQEHGCEGNRAPMEEENQHDEAYEARESSEITIFEHEFTQGEQKMVEIQQREEAFDEKLQTITTKGDNDKESTVKEDIPTNGNTGTCNREEADHLIWQEDEKRQGSFDETASELKSGDNSFSTDESSGINDQEKIKEVYEMTDTVDKDKETKIEIIDEEHGIADQLPISTGKETIECCQEDETKAEEHEKQMAGEFDTASAGQDNEKQILVEKNRNQEQLLASIQKEITEECSKDEKVTANMPQEEVQQVVQWADGGADTGNQNTKQAKDNFAASTREQPKESLCLKEKEHEKEFGQESEKYEENEEHERAGVDTITENKIKEESANTNLPSSAAEEEKVEENMKEELRDTTKSIKEVPLHIKGLEHNLEATCHSETRSKDLDHGTKPTKDCSTQGTTGTSTETLQKETNEDLVQNSSSMPEMLEKEKTEENLQTAETIITEVTEDAELEEIEREDKMQSDSSGLAIIKPHETLSYNIHTAAKSTEASNLGKHDHVEIQTAVENEEGEAERNIEHVMQTETKDASSKSDNQNWDSTRETPLEEISEQKPKEPSTQPSNKHRIMKDETSETPEEVEASYTSIFSPLATEEVEISKEDKPKNSTPDHNNTISTYMGKENENQVGEEATLNTVISESEDMELSESIKTSEVVECSEIGKLEALKDENSLNTEAGNKSEATKPVINEAPMCAEAYNTSTNTKKAALELENSGRNSEISLTVDVDMEAAVFGHSETKDTSNMTDENPESVNPHEQPRCISGSLAANQTNEALPTAKNIIIDIGSITVKDQESMEEKATGEEVQSIMDGEIELKTQDVNNTVEDIIFIERVPGDIERADESKNIKEQITSEKSCSTEVQIMSATDETANEVKEADQIASENIEATDSTDITGTEKQHTLEDLSWKLEESCNKKALEEEIENGIVILAVEVSEEKIIGENIKELEKLDTKKDTALATEVNSSERVQRDGKFARGSDTTSDDKSSAIKKADFNLNREEVGSVKLKETSGQVSQLKTIECNNSDKKSAIIEKPDEDEALVAETRTTDVISESKEDDVEKIHETVKSPIVERYDTRKFEEDIRGFPETTSEPTYQGAEVISKVVMSPNWAFPAGNLMEQLQVPSSDTLSKDNDHESTTIIEKIDNERSKKEETPLYENLGSVATRTKEEACMQKEKPWEVSKSECEHNEDVQKAHPNEEPKEERIAQVEAATPTKPEEYVSKINFADTPSETGKSAEIGKSLLSCSLGTSEHKLLDPLNSDKESDYLDEMCKVASTLEDQKTVKVVESMSKLHYPEGLPKSKEMEMKKKPLMAAPTDSTAEKNQIVKTKEAHETTNNEASSEKIAKRIKDESDAVKYVGDETNHTFQTTENAIQNKKVPGGFERTDESENVKENINIKGSCSTEFHLMLAADETVNEVKEKDRIPSENIEATDSSDNTETEKQRTVEDLEQVLEASYDTKALEEEIEKHIEKPVDVITSAAEVSEEKIIEEDIKETEKHDKTETSLAMEEKSLEKVQLDDKLVRDFDPTLNDMSVATRTADSSLKEEEVDRVKLEQTADLVSQLKIIECDDADKESVIIRKPDEDEAQTGETGTTDVISESGKQDVETIHENVKSTIVERYNTDKFEEDIGKVPGTIFKTIHQGAEVISKDFSHPDQALPAGNLMEQLQVPSSATPSKGNDRETSTITEKIEDESSKKEEALLHDNLEGSFAEKAKGEACTQKEKPGEDSKSEHEHIEDVQKDCPSQTPKEERTAVVEATTPIEPQEYVSKINFADSPSETEQSVEIRKPLPCSSQGTSEEQFLDSGNSNKEYRYLPIPHLVVEDTLRTEEDEMCKETSTPEVQKTERFVESMSTLHNPEMLPSKSEETEERHVAAPTESTAEKSQNEKTNEANESIKHEISSEKLSKELENTSAEGDVKEQTASENVAPKEFWQDSVGAVKVNGGLPKEDEKRNVREAPIKLDTNEQGHKAKCGHTEMETAAQGEEVTSYVVELEKKEEDGARAKDNEIVISNDEEEKITGVNTSTEIDATAKEATHKKTGENKGGVSGPAPKDLIHEANETHVDNKEIANEDNSCSKSLKDDDQPNHTSLESDCDGIKIAESLNQEEQEVHANKPGSLSLNETLQEAADQVQDKKQHDFSSDMLREEVDIPKEAEGITGERDHKKDEEPVKFSTRRSEMKHDEVEIHSMTSENKGESQDQNEKLNVASHIKDAGMEISQVLDFTKAHGINQHLEKPKELKEVSPAVSDKKITAEVDLKASTETKILTICKEVMLVQQVPSTETFQAGVEDLKVGNASGSEPEVGIECGAEKLMVDECKETIEKPTNETPQVHGCLAEEGELMAKEEKLQDDKAETDEVKEAKTEEDKDEHKREDHPKESTEAKISTGNKDVTQQVQQEPTTKNSHGVGEDWKSRKSARPGSEVEVECEEEKTTVDEFKETAEKPPSTESPTASSSDLLLEGPTKETPQVHEHLTDERELLIRKGELEDEEAEAVRVEEAKIDQDRDEEEDNDDHKRADSSSDAPVMVGTAKDIDIKVAHKKSHNILSGVGSKVKHSIAKVKKVIIGKSSRPKLSSPK